MKNATNAIPRTSALKAVEHAIIARMKGRKGKKKPRYAIPTLWVTGNGRAKSKDVDPFDFYLGVVRRARGQKPPRPPKSSGGEWSRDAVIYNMFLRTTAAFDHNGNGVLDLPVNSDGFRESGTFLKAIAMLPYIKRLGATVIHLLPVTSIGHDGNKGSLGSPYAIRNPYELDENLSEPAIGLDVKTEFSAFVEAAHAAGLRIVVEFVFRTAAKDGDWVKQCPDWFYWIKEEIPLRGHGEIDEGKYGSPIFRPDELTRIHDAIHNGRLGQLPPPHEEYRNFFTAAPKPEKVQREQGRYIGTLDNGQRVKIPGAFADWPPDDNQPPWNDVTYLKLYDHRDFNYIGYNTIRMYDARLARSGHINPQLWDKIIGIIPYYQHEFDIDGVMIDMGHALPMDLKASMVHTAREVNPDFAFWDENFGIEKKSRHEGYNAVFGYLWHVQHVPQYMKDFLRRLQNETMPISFFATPENHNTHRAADRPGGVVFSRWSLVLNAFLPGIPFLHSGYELGETGPINTGLDFSNEEQRKYPSEKLPLFSEGHYNWLSKDEITRAVKSVMALRKKYHRLVLQNEPGTFTVLDDPNQMILAYARHSNDGKKRLAVVTNANCLVPETASIALETQKTSVINLLTKKTIKLTKGSLSLTLKPGEALLFEF